MINSNKELKILLKMLKEFNVTSFKQGSLEIFRSITVYEDKPDRLYYGTNAYPNLTVSNVKSIGNDEEEAKEIIEDLEDDNLLINDPEEYERKQREDVRK